MSCPVGLIADVHLANHKRHGGPVEAGINRRCRQALVTLELAVESALAEGAETLVVLGDLFDSVRPEPQIVAEAQRVFSKMPRTLVLLGNHDMVSTAAGDHAVGPLAPVKGLQIVDAPVVIPDGASGVDLVMVPFRPGPAREWLPVDVDALLAGKKSKRPRLLCLHLGLDGPGTLPFLQGHDDSVKAELLDQVMEKHGIGWAIAGNWHNRKLVELNGGRFALQCGTLVPTGWDNPGLEDFGTLALFSGEGPPGSRMMFVEIPGPRFVVAGDDALRSAVEATTGSGEIGWALYARRPVSDPAELGGAARALEEAVAAGTLSGGEVQLDDASAKAAAAGAAEAARSAATLSEAVASYVGRLEASEEDREWVSAYCLRALNA